MMPLQYMMLGAGEGRTLIAGQKSVKAFNARKGFDIFRRSPINRKGGSFFGTDYRRSICAFGGGGSSAPEPVSEPVKEQQKAQKEEETKRK